MRFKPLTQKKHLSIANRPQSVFLNGIKYWKNWDNNIHIPFSTLNFYDHYMGFYEK